MKDELIVFTALFGNSFHKLYRAPLTNNSFVFTDNKGLESECNAKGWNLVYLDGPILNSIKSEYQRASLRSKYVKFLGVLKDFPDLFLNKKYGLYFDHKFEVKESHIEELVKIKNNGLIIRKTPRVKNSVYEEIKDAMGQERYRTRMNELNNWLKIKLSEGYSPDVRICNTGLMLYDLSNQKVLDLCSEVYDEIMNVLNPECQVIWSIVSQKYKDQIKTISFEDVQMKWREPSL